MRYFFSDFFKSLIEFTKRAGLLTLPILIGLYFFGEIRIPLREFFLLIAALIYVIFGNIYLLESFVKPNDRIFKNEDEELVWKKAKEENFEENLKQHLFKDKLFTKELEKIKKKIKLELDEENKELKEKYKKQRTTSKKSNFRDKELMIQRHKKEIEKYRKRIENLIKKYK